jgi:hypothetical protein
MAHMAHKVNMKNSPEEVEEGPSHTESRFERAMMCTLTKWEGTAPPKPPLGTLLELGNGF